MKLKLDENGHAVLQDGKPVYVHDDGKEVAFDAAGTVATISRLNGEAKGHRERAEAAEKSLKAFEGITDPAAAIKALETVKNFDEKNLIAAGDRDKAVAEAVKAVEAKYEPVVKERDSLKTELYGEKIGGSFARSKLIADKLAIPADMVQARFGQAFKIEEGKVVAYDSNGNKVFSRTRPGELAEFDEALESLIEQYPHKDHILKSSGASGSGAAGSGNGGGGKKTINRAAFEALDPSARIAHMKDGGVVTD